MQPIHPSIILTNNPYPVYIKLNTTLENKNAVEFYKKFGFIIKEQEKNTNILMVLFGIR